MKFKIGDKVIYQSGAVKGRIVDSAKTRSGRAYIIQWDGYAYLMQTSEEDLTLDESYDNLVGNELLKQIDLEA